MNKTNTNIECNSRIPFPIKQKNIAFISCGFANFRVTQSLHNQRKKMNIN